MLKFFSICSILIVEVVNSASVGSGGLNENLVERIQSYMKTSVDPCEDFYEYACGNWPIRHPLETGHYENKQLLMANQRISSEIKELLEKLLLEKHTSISQSEQKVKAFYKSCINKPSDEENRKSVLEIVDSFGIWPILNENNWKEEDFNWLNLTAHLRLYGINALMQEVVLTNWKDSQQNVIYIDSADFGKYGIEDYLNPVENDTMSTAGITINIYFFGKPGEVARDFGEEYTFFEIKRAAIVNTNLTKVSTPKLETVKYLIKRIPQIDWKTYFSIILGRPVELSQIISIFDEKYLEKLAVLISQTDSRILANYLMYQIIENYYLEKRDSQTCMEQVMEKFGPVIGAMYSRGRSNDETLKHTSEMIREIQNSFKENFKNLDWLDDSTRSVLEEKLNRMTSIVGFNSVYNDFEKLDADYADLEIDENNYYKNLLKISHHLTKVEHKRLSETPSQATRFWQPAEASARYNLKDNYIIIPLGLLQPPFYENKYPESFIFGGIGSLIGHVTTNGFDAYSRQFDAHGLIGDWWTASAIEKFDENSKCFTSQYEKYLESEFKAKLKTELILRPNIADNSGIRHSFYAYQNWIKKNPNKEDLLVSKQLNMTNEQLFFVSFAQTFCGIANPNEILFSLPVIKHTPAKYRIIGSLSNFEEFSKEYKCPSGSFMNPENKCKIF